VSVESVRSNPVWQNMSPAKRKIMEDALRAGNAQSGNMEKTATVIFKAINEMKKAGESFSKTETDVLIEELMKGMSAKDRAKVSMIRSLINNKE